MRDETSRRRPDDRPHGQVEETDVAAAPVDEDAAAFLQEAAEAAAAAALDAQALAEEVEAAGREAAGAGSPSGVDAGSDADEARAAADVREVESDASADGIAAEADEAAPEGADGVRAAAREPAGEDASILRAADLVLDEDAAGARDEDDRPAPARAEGSEADDRREAELLEALAEEAPTAEEEALAQASGDADEDDVEPAEIAEPAEPEEEQQGAFERIAARARRLDEDQARHVIHSILFVADKPLTVEQLRAATGLEPARVRASLERLAGELREGLSGVVLSEVAGGWQLRTAPESAEFVRRFLQVKPRRLTRAALETLAIIAYRQPVTRPEIEDIRGVDSGAVVKALLDWKLIKILGKKDEVGRPLLYGTSREFLEFFQLKDLASLPTLREFHELSEESVQIVEEELGPEAAAGIAGTVAELTDPAYLEAEKARAAKSEQALAELEQALADAEEKAADVAETIAPKKAGEQAPDRS